MSSETPKVDDSILDDQFRTYLSIGMELVRKMRCFEDRSVAVKHIRKGALMSDAESTQVKVHRNRFFRYLLKVMKKTVELQDSNVFVDKVSVGSFNRGGFELSFSSTEHSWRLR
jgi:hypothetical protein